MIYVFGRGEVLVWFAIPFVLGLMVGLLAGWAHWA